jgi:hypothetical protein
VWGEGGGRGGGGGEGGEWERERGGSKGALVVSVSGADDSVCDAIWDHCGIGVTVFRILL